MVHDSEIDLNRNPSSDNEINDDENNNENDSTESLLMEDEVDQNNDDMEEETETVNSIKEEIIKLFSNKEEFVNEGESLSKIIAKRTVELINQKEETKKRVKDAEESWEEQGDGTIVCKSCRAQALNKNCPSYLRGVPKGTIGIFNYTRARNTRKSMVEHLSHPYHLWAVDQEKKAQLEREDKKEKNRKAGEMIVTNAIHCFKDASSTSFDFVRLNNKDRLNEIIGEAFAFKNDGRQNYFLLRDVVFLKLSECVKNMIRKTEVISVTLDKVTVSSTSYVVVLTYFFLHGRIHVVLNEIHPMKCEELTGEGTADFLIDCLQRTLGLSVEEVREKLEHLVFDGVYEEPENRPKGGGSLSLVSHLTEQLNLGPDIITGTWDFGHRIQLVLNDCFQNGSYSKEYKDTSDFMYQLMAKYREDKSAMIFKETADSLNMAPLKNQKKSDTRWARQDLTANATFFRNAPTMFIVLGREAEQYRREKNNTKLKQVMKLLEKLQDPSFWLHALGYTQILDLVTEVSLVAQRVGTFPTTVFTQLISTLDELVKLGTNKLILLIICINLYSQGQIGSGTKSWSARKALEILKIWQRT